MVSEKQLQANRKNALKAGRPKILDDKIIAKQQKRYRQRASKLAMSILATQALNALGTHTLMRIDEIVTYKDDGKVDKKGNPTKSRYVERKYVVVTDPEEIETVINDFGDVDGSGVVDGKYYFITHEKPNNQAADSILNRAWGKPKETIEMTNTEPEQTDEELQSRVTRAVQDYLGGSSPIPIEAKVVYTKIQDIINPPEYENKAIEASVRENLSFEESYIKRNG